MFRTIGLVVVLLSVSTGCTFFQRSGTRVACSDAADCTDGTYCEAGFCVVGEPASNSCEGHCGEELEGCFCDVQCLQNGDCCDDFVPVCGGSSDAASCVNRCGGLAPVGCLCDVGCDEAGDCCPDYAANCEEIENTDGGVIVNDADGGVIVDVDGLSRDSVVLSDVANTDAGPVANDVNLQPIDIDFALSDYISIDQAGSVVSDWPLNDEQNALRIGPPGGGRIVYEAPVSGRYNVSVLAAAELGDNIGPHVELRLNNVVVFEHDVSDTNFRDYSGQMNLSAGINNIDVVFTNDVFIAPGNDRNLLLGPMTLSTYDFVDSPDAGPVNNTDVEVGRPDVSMGAPDVTVPNDEVPIIVAVGWQGLRMLSIDEGQSWCETGLMVDGHDDLFRGAGVHNGLIVGAHAGRANRGAIIVSRDGWRWEALHRTNYDESLPDNPTRQWFANAAYGNGRWLAMGGCGTSATSPDGLQWTSQGSQFDGCSHVRDLHFGDGMFVASVQFNDRPDGTEYDWYQSPSGLDGTWTLREANAGQHVNHYDGQFNGDSNSLGRGICLFSTGFSSNRRIHRSTNQDCSDAVVTGEPAAAIQQFVFSSAPAELLEPSLMPEELRSCLYPE